MPMASTIAEEAEEEEKGNPTTTISGPGNEQDYSCTTGTFITELAPEHLRQDHEDNDEEDSESDKDNFGMSKDIQRTETEINLDALKEDIADIVSKGVEIVNQISLNNASDSKEIATSDIIEGKKDETIDPNHNIKAENKMKELYTIKISHIETKEESIKLENVTNENLDAPIIGLNNEVEGVNEKVSNTKINTNENHNKIDTNEDILDDIVSESNFNDDIGEELMSNEHFPIRKLSAMESVNNEEPKSHDAIIEQEGDAEAKVDKTQEQLNDKVNSEDKVQSQSPAFHEEGNNTTNHDVIPKSPPEVPTITKRTEIKANKEISKPMRFSKPSSKVQEHHLSSQIHTSFKAHFHSKKADRRSKTSDDIIIPEDLDLSKVIQSSAKDFMKSSRSRSPTKSPEKANNKRVTARSSLTEWVEESNKARDQRRQRRDKSLPLFPDLCLEGERLQRGSRHRRNWRHDGEFYWQMPFRHQLWNDIRRYVQYHLTKFASILLIFSFSREQPDLDMARLDPAMFAPSGDIYSYLHRRSLKPFSYDSPSNYQVKIATKTSRNK